MKKAKVTRLKLTIENGNDFILLGIVSAEPDYKLSLSLNSKFGISLSNISPISSEELESSFSRFSNNNKAENLSMTLISNRSGKFYLLSKLRNIDFLLQLQDSHSKKDIESLTAKLRELEGVTAVFIIDTENLKDKNLAYF